jgi:Cys-rich protein (TIGR01571 family)
MGVKEILRIVPFMPAWPSLVMVGSCRYVESVISYKWSLSTSIQIQNRGNIRSRYNIRGGSMDDCLTSYCCRSCALTQERREIELEENSFEGFSQSK